MAILHIKLHKPHSIFKAEKDTFVHKLNFEGILLGEDESSLCVEDAEGYQYPTLVDVTFTEQLKTEHTGTLSYEAKWHDEDSNTSFPGFCVLLLPVNARLWKFIESSGQSEHDFYLCITTINDGDTKAIEARGEWHWKPSLCNEVQARIERIELIPAVQKLATEIPVATTECKDQNALHTFLNDSEVGAAHLAELRKIRVLLIVAIVLEAAYLLAKVI